VDLLTSTAKATLLRDIRDEMLRTPHDQPIEFALRRYGVLLIEGDMILEKADDIVRSLFNGILGRKSAIEFFGSHRL